MAQAYCVKCKKKVEIQNPKQVVMKNKRPATKGVCPKCGTTVFRIGQASSPFPDSSPNWTAPPERTCG